MPGARISENGLRRIHDLQQTTESEGGEMTEYNIKINDGYEKIGEVKAINFTTTIDNLCGEECMGLMGCLEEPCQCKKGIALLQSCQPRKVAR